MHRGFVVSVLALGIMATITASSNSAPVAWFVKKASGSAVYSTGITQASLQPGLSLDSGTTVQTGENGRVLLTRSQDWVFIGPYTSATIAPHSALEMQTTVILERGYTSFNISKRGKPHFSVETPYLVAVVKGTKFKIAVGSSSTEVFVTEGIVEVTARVTGRSVNLRAGQKATVDMVGNLSLQGNAAAQDVNSVSTVNSTEKTKTVKVKKYSDLGSVDASGGGKKGNKGDTGDKGDKGK